MLKVKNLKVNYGHISALNGISFEVPDNSIVSLIGANGAGKTTTLMAISGLVDAAEGQILLDNMDITDCRPSSIVQMGVCHVPEGRHVFPELSVYENLVAGAIPCKKLPRAELQSRIEQQFELFPRLKERSSQMAGTMSGGEQQMLAMGRALMSNASMLMMDEPSMGLSPLLVQEIFDIIRDIHKAGMTILLVEQNAQMALSVADRAYVLETGHVVMDGTGAELLTNERVRSAYLGG